MKMTDEAKSYIGMTAGVSMIDKVNMNGASLSLTDQEDGFVIPVQDMCIMEGIDSESGEAIIKGFIVDENGEIYGTVSDTAIRTMHDAFELVELGIEFDFIVTKQRSKQGREFIVLKAARRGNGKGVE